MPEPFQWKLTELTARGFPKTEDKYLNAETSQNPGQVPKFWAMFECTWF